MNEGYSGTPGERYVAPMHELMILQRECIVAPRLGEGDVYILGTPDQFLAFDPSAQPPVGNRNLTVGDTRK
jgi:hypothetical protein